MLRWVHGVVTKKNFPIEVHDVGIALWHLISESRYLFGRAQPYVDEEEFVLSGLNFPQQNGRIFAKGVEKCLISRWGTHTTHTGSFRELSYFIF